MESVRPPRGSDRSRRSEGVVHEFTSVAALAEMLTPTRTTRLLHQRRPASLLVMADRYGWRRCTAESVRSNSHSTPASTSSCLVVRPRCTRCPTAHAVCDAAAVASRLEVAGGRTTWCVEDPDECRSDRTGPLGSVECRRLTVRPLRAGQPRSGDRLTRRRRAAATLAADGPAGVVRYRAQWLRLAVLDVCECGCATSDGSSAGHEPVSADEPAADVIITQSSPSSR